MKYVLLIYSDESMAANMPPEMMTAFMGEYEAYTRDIMSAGVRLAGEALQPTSTATTVENKDGNVVTTHGPFAETKERLLGFYTFDADSLEEATTLAAKLVTPYVRLEIRPVGWTGGLLSTE